MGLLCLLQAPKGLQLHQERTGGSEFSSPSLCPVLSSECSHTGGCLGSSQMTHSLLKCQYETTGSGISTYATVRLRAPQLICPHHSCLQMLLWHCNTPQTISRIVQVTSAFHTHHGYVPAKLLRHSPFQCKFCNVAVQKA